MAIGNSTAIAAVFDIHIEKKAETPEHRGEEAHRAGAGGGHQRHGDPMVQAGPAHGLGHDEAGEEQHDDRVEEGSQHLLGGAHVRDRQHHGDGQRGHEERDELRDPEHEHRGQQPEHDRGVLRWPPVGGDGPVLGGDHRDQLDRPVGQLQLDGHVGDGQIRASRRPYLDHDGIVDRHALGHGGLDGAVGGLPAEDLLLGVADEDRPLLRREPVDLHRERPLALGPGVGSHQHPDRGQADGERHRPPACAPSRRECTVGRFAQR